MGLPCKTLRSKEIKVNINRKDPMAAGTLRSTPASRVGYEISSDTSLREGTIMAGTFSAGVAALAIAFYGSTGHAETVSPEGLWDIDGRATVQIYACDGALCGKVAGLTPRNPNAPRPYVDVHNPDPALQTRPLCGLTVISGLQPVGADRWTGGQFYNPESGQSYRLNAEMNGQNVIIARIFRGVPLFGETKFGYRLPPHTIKGRC